MRRKGAYPKLVLRTDKKIRTLDDFLILLFTTGKEYIRPEDRTTIKAAKKLLYRLRDNEEPFLSENWLDFVIIELLADEHPKEAQELAKYLEELRAKGLKNVTIRKKIEERAAELGVLNRFNTLKSLYIKARRYLLDAGLIEKRNDVYKLSGGIISYLNRIVEVISDFRAGEL